MYVWNENLIVERPTIPSGRRILAVSDIHGNLPYFDGLLKKAGFGADDTLIIAGDFLERGDYCLATLRRVMELYQGGNVHPLCGNCDCWFDAVDYPEGYTGSRILKYVLYKRKGIIYEMLRECGVELTEESDITAALAMLGERYKPEWDFLRSLPMAVDTPHYTFVHGGIRPDQPLDQQRCGDCMKMDDFRGRGWKFDKWVVVGHWPVTLYREDRVRADPLIDRDRKIVSIDGGCVLKDDGQLNALVIPFEGSEDFSCVRYDRFPVKKVVSAQSPSERSYHIRWGDSEIQVLRRGDEFSRCRHVRTGYEMDILTKYIYTDEDGSIHANDCSDYFLALKPGDEVGVVEETSRGYYVKLGGDSGWYRGELI